MSSTLNRMSVVAALVLGLAVGSAYGVELDTIRAMVRDGRHAQALELLDGVLGDAPEDAQARFLRGVVLAELERTDDAITVFKGLAKDLPELPEPHNNLAVLYAARGDYDLARDALLVAIHTHPSYATAHENLGDIYAKMAGIAYDKALQLDDTNTSAKSKLNLIDELFSVSGTIAEPARQVASATVAPAPSPTAKSTPIPTPEAAAGNIDDVLPTLVSWSQAWSEKNVERYLGFYDAAFDPPGRLGRAAWEQQRRARLLKPRFIEVELSDAAVSADDETTVSVTFTQRYRSDTFDDQVRKRMQLEWSQGRWKIVDERTVP